MKTSNLKGLVIEPFGMKLPTLYYDRLNSLTQRATKADITVDVDEQGVIIQECVIIADSLSLLEGIMGFIEAQIKPYCLEKYNQAPAVYLFGMELLTAETPHEGIKVWQKTDAVLSKRGRKPAASDWAITCLECLSVTHEETHNPIQCGECGGLRIHARKNGRPVTFKDNADLSISELFMKTRFTVGSHWEPAAIDSTNPDAIAPRPLDAVRMDAEDKAVWAALKDSPLIDQLDKLERTQAIRVLDAVFAARKYHKKAERSKARGLAVLQYFAHFDDGQNGMPQMVSVGEAAPDILDSALILGSDTAARIYLDYLNK